MSEGSKVFNKSLPCPHLSGGIQTSFGVLGQAISEGQGLALCLFKPLVHMSDQRLGTTSSTQDTSLWRDRKERKDAMLPSSTYGLAPLAELDWSFLTTRLQVVYKTSLLYTYSPSLILIDIKGKVWSSYNIANILTQCITTMYHLKAKMFILILIIQIIHSSVVPRIIFKPF